MMLTPGPETTWTSGRTRGWLCADVCEDDVSVFSSLPSRPPSPSLCWNRLQTTGARGWGGGRGMRVHGWGGGGSRAAGSIIRCNEKMTFGGRHVQWWWLFGHRAMSLLSVCLSACLSVCPSVSQSVCPSVCLSVCLSFRPSVCLSVRLSVCLSVCLSVSLLFVLNFLFSD